MASKVRTNIQRFKEEFPNNGLDFLDDPDWLENATQIPKYALLDVYFSRLHICRLCHKRNGEFLNTDKCPGSIPVLDKPASTKNKTIEFQNTKCGFILNRDRLKEIESIFTTSGVLEEWIDRATLENFNASRHPQCTEALKICRRYCDKFDELAKDGIGLYIFGPPYIGKTHLVVATAAEIARRTNYPFRYIPVTRLITTYRKKLSASFSDYDTEDDAFTFISEQISNFDGIVILDDIGSEVPTDATVGLLNTVISSRVEKRMVTFFTSFYSLDRARDSLLSKYSPFGVPGSSLVARIKQVSGIINMESVPTYPKRIEI